MKQFNKIRKKRNVSICKFENIISQTADCVTHTRACAHNHTHTHRRRPLSLQASRPEVTPCHRLRLCCLPWRQSSQCSDVVGVISPRPPLRGCHSIKTLGNRCQHTRAHAQTHTHTLSHQTASKINFSVSVRQADFTMVQIASIIQRVQIE